MNKKWIFTTSAFFICVFFAFSGSATATDTLDCTFEDSLLRLHVNSEGAVADGILYRGKNEYKIQNLHNVKLKWATGLPPYQGNSLKVEHLKNEELPPFTVGVAGTKGTITLEGEARPIICDWER